MQSSFKQTMDTGIGPQADLSLCEHTSVGTFSHVAAQWGPSQVKMV